MMMLLHQIPNVMKLNKGRSGAVPSSVRMKVSRVRVRVRKHLTSTWWTKPRPKGGLMAKRLVGSVPVSIRTISSSPCS